MHLFTTRLSWSTRYRMLVMSTALLLGLALLTVPQTVSAQSPAPVDLGAAGAFGVLAGTTVTSTGGTAITGDVGLSPGSAIAGFPPATLTGTMHINTPEAVNGQAALGVAYNDAVGRSTGPITVAGNIGGLTLAPGIYKSQTSLAISSGDLTLDAQGDPNAVWIFQIGSTLTATSGRQVILTGGAEAANVFWQVGTSATIGTNASFAGTIMASVSISLETGAILNGRALAIGGAVSLDNDAVTVPTIVVPPLDVTLTLPNIDVDANAAISIPIWTNNIDGSGVLAFDFTVDYDPNILTLDGVDLLGTLSVDANVTVNASLGSIHVAGTVAAEFAGSGVFINLTGMSHGAGNSGLVFVDLTLNGGGVDSIGVDGNIEVSAFAGVTLTLADINVDANAAISIPVWTYDIDGSGVLAFDFTVDYDPNILTLDGVDLLGTLSVDANVTVNASLGSIHVVGTTLSAVAGSGVFINLTGTSHGVGNSGLVFTDLTLNNGAVDSIGEEGSIDVSVFAGVTLTLANINVAANTAISIPITTNSIDGSGVLTFDFTVDYDPNILTLDGVDLLGTLSVDANVTVNASLGSIHVAGTVAAEFAGSGVFINLTGMSHGAGNSGLVFVDLTLNGGAVNGVGVDGSVDVAAAADITLTLPNNAAGTNAPIELAVTTIDIDGKGALSFDFTVEYDANVLTLNGVRTNGTLSENAVITINAALGQIQVSGVQASEISGGGALLYLTGTSSGVGNSDLTFTDVTFNSGVLAGTGVDGSLQVVADLPSEVITLTLPTKAAGINAPIELAVTTIDIDGKGILSYDFTAVYDANVLTLDGVRTEGTLSENAVVTVNATLGQIHVSGVQASDITGGGALLYLTGTSSGVGNSSLVFTNVTFNEGADVGLGVDGSLRVVADLPGEVATLTLPNNAAGTNAPIELAVTTIDINGKGILSYDFTVVYDANVLTLDGVRTNLTLSENAVVTVDATLGRIHVSGVQASDVTGGGALIYLTGTSSGVGSSNLTFTNVTFNEGADVGVGVDGSLQVVADLPSEVVMLTLPNNATGINAPIELAVTTIDMDGKGVRSYDFTVVYDASVLTLDGVRTDGTLSENAVITVDATLGRIHVSGVQASDITGGGALLYLTGTSSGVGNSNLAFTNVTFNDGAPIGLGVDGSLQVVADLPSEVVTLTLPNNAAGINAPIELAVTTVDMDGKGVRSYDFTVVYDASVLTLDGVRTSGTLSENAVVTVDATLGRIHVSGVQASDISGGGALLYLTGTSSGVGNSNLAFTDVTFNAGAPVGAGVDGSLRVVADLPSEVVTLTLPNNAAGTNAPIELAVTTIDINGKGVRSYDFSIVYDASVLTLDGVRTSGTLSENAVVTVDATLGRIHVSGVQASDMTGGGALIYLTGTSSGVGNSNLTFTNVTFNDGADAGVGIDGSLQVVADLPSEVVTLTLPNNAVEINAPIELAVTTIDMDGKGVRSYDFTVVYDANLLTLDGVRTNATLSSNAVVTVDATTGRIHVSGVQATDFSGGGALLYLTGTSSGGVGNSSLAFTDVSFNAGAPTGLGVDGSLQVGTVLPAEIVTIVMHNIRAETNSAISIPVTTADIGGRGVLSYDFTATYDPNVITLDGVETIGTLSEDATITVDAANGSIHVVGTSSTTFAGSGVLLYLTGTSNNLGTTPVAFSNVTLNSGSPFGIGVDGSVDVVTEMPVADITLTLPDMNAGANTAISIPMSATNMDGHGVLSYYLTVEYDPSVITIDGVDAMGTLSEGAAVLVHLTEGAIHLTGSSTTPFSGTGVLINLTGTSNGTGTSGLTFNHVSFNDGIPYGVGVDGSIQIGTTVPAAAVTMTLPAMQVEDNIAISVPVTTLDMDGEGVLSYDFIVNYDPAVLTLDGVNTSGTLSEGATMTVNATSGSIHVVGTSTTAFSGSGVLVYLTGTSGNVGMSDMTFANVTMNGGTPVGTGVDGSLQVVAGAPDLEATLTLPRTGTEPNVAISLPVLTRDVEGKNVVSYDFTVAYDPSIITLDDVRTTGTLSEDATVTVNSATGTIRVTGTRSHTFSQSGVLVYLTGTSSSSGNTDLTFTNVTLNAGGIIGHGVDGNIIVTVGVANEESGDLPVEFALQGNYPNPFNPSTTISFDLPETAEVSVGIFDILGRQVMTVPSSTIQAGSNRGLRIDASSLTSGMYLYRVMATSATRTHIMSGRMSLMK